MFVKAIDMVSLYVMKMEIIYMLCTLFGNTLYKVKNVIM